MELDVITRQLPRYSALYHNKVIPQHLQYYFLNRQHSLSGYLESTAAAYESLNYANLLLGKCLRAATNKTSHAFADKMNGYIDEWHSMYKAGKVYNTFSYANKVYQSLLEAGYPIQDEIRENKEVLDAFTNISYTVKAAFQIEIWVSETNLISFLEKSISSLSERPYLFYYFKEMTIPASPIMPGPFYNIKFRLISEIVSTFRNPLVQEAVDMVSEWNEVFPEIEIIERPFTLKTGNNSSVSQGNFSYKQFLHMIGAIDLVYDAGYDYAYLLNA